MTCHMKHSGNRIGVWWARRLAALSVFSWLGAASVWAGPHYWTNRQLADELAELGRLHPELVRPEKVAETREGHALWLVEVGAGTAEDRRQRPALLVVAGIEGNDQYGTACALAWIRGLAESQEANLELRDLVASTTFYVFPRLNPDAAERFFAKPKMELAVNGRPVDDDHDGLADEDGPEDLNGDGLITWMRVEDPEGEYILEPAEPRLLMKADRLRGERGTWRYLVEGRDNDQDEAWNEDGPGGVNFNRNFPFDYQFFAPWAGEHQVSEVETRALADFVLEHRNIGVAFTFGAADNLLQTPKSEAPKVPPETIRPDDLGYYREIGSFYRETLGLKKELSGSRQPGTFSDWMYYHLGRLSLAASPWSPALQLESGKKETKGGEEKPPAESASDSGVKAPPKAEGEKAPAGEGGASADKPKGDKRTEEDRAFLRWIDEHAPGAFVPWQVMAHPDFPGQKVEVGGFAPYARTVPPEAVLAEWVSRHIEFLNKLGGKLPRIAIRKAEVKALGESVFDVRVQVENGGYLPTVLSQGEVTREVLPTRVEFRISEESVLAGARRVRLGPLAGRGGMETVRVVLHVPNQLFVEVEVISALSGRTSTKVVLREKE